MRSNRAIVYKIKYNEYWKENIKLFKAGDFIAKSTHYIPPKHLIHYYDLYTIRKRGKTLKDRGLIKFSYRYNTFDDKPEESLDGTEETQSIISLRYAWHFIPNFLLRKV